MDADDVADSEIAYVETERIEVDPDDLPEDIGQGIRRKSSTPPGTVREKVSYHFIERERAVVTRGLLDEGIATANRVRRTHPEPHAP